MSVKPARSWGPSISSPAPPPPWPRPPCSRTGLRRSPAGPGPAGRRHGAHHDPLLPRLLDARSGPGQGHALAVHPGHLFLSGPAMALVQNLAPPKMRAMFIAISLLLANVLNLIVAPQGVGWLSDAFGGAHGPSAVASPGPPHPRAHRLLGSLALLGRAARRGRRADRGGRLRPSHVVAREVAGGSQAATSRGFSALAWRYRAVSSALRLCFGARLIRKPARTFLSAF